MREFKGANLSNRLEDAKRAKQALLRKAGEAPKLDDPAVVAQRAAKQAAAIKHDAERARRAEQKAIQAKEQAEREAAEQVERKALAESAKLKSAEQQVALAAEQKAARDARYAARKNRKG